MQRNLFPLLILASLIMIALVAGCTSSVSNSATITPTPQIVYVTVTVPVTPIPTTTSTQDPIVGVWRYSLSNSAGSVDIRVRFNADNTFKLSTAGSSLDTTSYSGTWAKEGSGTYILNPGSSALTFIYLPAQNAIYWDEHPDQFYYPFSGDVMTVSSTPTSGSTSKSLSYSGTGDDIKSFSVTGGGGFIITGSNSGSSNFIVHITGTSGNIEEFVFNEIGPYSGKKIAHIDPGNHYLDVTAEGPWTITLTSA
jgi:hypothetical protein